MPAKAGIEPRLSRDSGFPLARERQDGRKARCAKSHGRKRDISCATTPSFRSARGRLRPASALRCRWRSSPGRASSRAGAMRSRWLKRSRRLRRRRAIGLVFKSSFDKANRTSGSGQARGGAQSRAADLCRNPRDAGLARHHRRAREQPMRAGCASGRRVADPGFPLPPDRSSGRRGRDPAGPSTSRRVSFSRLGT